MSRRELHEFIAGRPGLFCCRQTASKELMRAADESQEITLTHFHRWSPASFQQNYKSVTFHDRDGPPDPQIFEVAKTGRWGSRDVTLFRPKNESGPLLYLHGGDELREPSCLLGYPEIDKLPEAFELTSDCVVS